MILGTLKLYEMKLFTTKNPFSIGMEWNHISFSLSKREKYNEMIDSFS